MPTAQSPARPVTELLLEIAYHLHATRVVGRPGAPGRERPADRTRPRADATGPSIARVSAATAPTGRAAPTAALAS